MNTVLLFVAGIVTAIAAFFGIRRDAKARGAREQQEKQRLAAEAVNRALEKKDRSVDAKAQRLAAAVEKEHDAVKARIVAGTITGVDANALIDRVKGDE
jgi:hypothetical protein